MLAKDVLNVRVNSRAICPNWQNLPWCIDNIGSILIKTKRIVTCVQIHIVIIKKHSLEPDALIADSFNII